MRATVNFPAHGGPALPPSLLFRNLSLSAADFDLSPVDAHFMKRSGARNKLRIGNFLTFTGSPGIWGPTSTNSAMLAAAEINKRGGILGRELAKNIAVIIVEQHLDLARRVADYAYVLDRGRVALQGQAGEVRDNPELVRYLAP
ncbi:ABC-type branched-subunit amino acid transport system substrate-binding protein [Bradyrhizobium betae]|nr:ABC-type branched-subunit amino acid transport system substrate-binding protein [Bradyrhizobium betae]